MALDPIKVQCRHSWAPHTVPYKASSATSSAIIEQVRGQQPTYIIFQEGPCSIKKIPPLDSISDHTCRTWPAGVSYHLFEKSLGGLIRHGSGLLSACPGNIVRYCVRGMLGSRDRGLRDDWILRVDNDRGPISSIGSIFVG